MAHTAVVPLKSQSTLAWTPSSLSMASNALAQASRHSSSICAGAGDDRSLRLPSVDDDAAGDASLKAGPSPSSSEPRSSAFRWLRIMKGRWSLASLLTSCPQRPCPSNTPQNTPSSMPNPSLKYGELVVVAVHLSDRTVNWWWVAAVIFFVLVIGRTVPGIF
uniref:Uncharacterized protein n=1 Tax=Zea mays TaxID=4577 RepID=C4J4B3_MAIZE|nr:unknown [Zea mays]